MSQNLSKLKLPLFHRFNFEKKHIYVDKGTPLIFDIFYGFRDHTFLLPNHSRQTSTEFFKNSFCGFYNPVVTSLRVS